MQMASTTTNHILRISWYHAASRVLRGRIWRRINGLRR
jgi:hypothetical protein